MSHGLKRGSGQRSGLYSSSKSSNWTPFDPYSSEVSRVLRQHLVPAARIEDASVPVYAVALHPQFLRPCSTGEVAGVLSKIPRPFLRGLRGVYLLGGTIKQARAARGSLFRFGCYSGGAILLHAFPRDLLRSVARRALKPSVAHEYERAGARIVSMNNRWSIEFDELSLRRFYLHDVLLHELGHHIDERRLSRPSAEAERYAEWFVQEQNRRRREEGAA